MNVEEMRVGSGQFLHELLSARKSALILDKEAGHMVLRVFGWGDDRVTDIFKTPAVGKLDPEYYDDLYLAVSNAVLVIAENHHGTITVSYAGT